VYRSAWVNCLAPLPHSAPAARRSSPSSFPSAGAPPSAAQIRSPLAPLTPQSVPSPAHRSGVTRRPIGATLTPGAGEHDAGARDLLESAMTLGSMPSSGNQKHLYILELLGMLINKALIVVFSMAPRFLAGDIPRTAARRHLHIPVFGEFLVTWIPANRRECERFCFRG